MDFAYILISFIIKKVLRKQIGGNIAKYNITANDGL